MTRVFISYSRKDKHFAEKFTTRLTQSDLETWIDWEDIPASADWLDQIHKGIQSSDGFLFLLSPDSIVSTVCKQEVDHAIQNGKRLIPIVVRDVEVDKVPAALAKLNWIYCREGDDFEQAIERTLDAIRTDLSWVEFHRRLQVRALEWEQRQDASLLLRGRDLRQAEERLAFVGQKDPQPTDLQRQYALASRRGESRRRNLLLAIGAVILVILFSLSIFANNQRILAQNNEETAVANLSVASTEKVNAQNQRATAVANADLALARQLAAQSQLLAADTGMNMIQSALLSIESLRLYPTVEGDQALRRNLLLFPKPVSSMQLAGDFLPEVSKILFGPDGKWLLSVSADDIARVWDISTGKEISHLKHEGTITNLILSPDGRLVASSDGTTIISWEALTGKELARMSDADGVWCLSFSADGKRLVSGGGGAVKVWDTETGRELSSLLPAGHASAVAFSRDGAYIATYNLDSLHVWDALTGKELASTQFGGGVITLAFTPNGELILAGGPEEVREWYWKTNETYLQTNLEGNLTSLAIDLSWRWMAAGGRDGSVVIQEIGSDMVQARARHDWSGGADPVMGQVQALEFSPDGRYVLSGSDDGTGRIWEAGTGKEIARLAADEYYGAEDVVDGFVNAVAFSPDGTLAATGNDHGLIRVWDFNTGIETGSLELEHYINSNIIFSPDGSRLAYEGNGLVLRDWDGLSMPGKTRELSHPGVFWTVGFTSDGKRVFSQGQNFIAGEANADTAHDTAAWIWDTDTGQEVAAIDRQHLVAFSPNGNWAVSHRDGHTLVLWDVASGKQVKQVDVENDVYSIAVSPEGDWVASAGSDAVSVWDVSTGREVFQMSSPGGAQWLAFSPDQRWLASSTSFTSSGASSSIVRAWDTGSGREVGLIRQDGGLTALAFSPDSRYLVSVSGEMYGSVSLSPLSQSTMVIWDSVARAEIARVSFDTDMTAIVFSPDGKWVTPYGNSNIARIFELATGMEANRIKHSDDWPIRALTFSPDGKWLLTYDAAGLLKAWDWHPADLVTDLCSRLPRNLTRTEWNLYLVNQPYRATCPNLPADPAITPTPLP